MVIISLHYTMAQYKGASEEARRAQQMMQRREQEKQQLEDRKRKIVEEMHLGDIDGRFSAHFDSIEQTIKAKTVGLVTLDEMKATQQKIVEEREKEYVQQKRRRLAADDDAKLKPTKIKTAVLSFLVEDGAEDDIDANDANHEKPSNAGTDNDVQNLASEMHALDSASPRDNGADETFPSILPERHDGDEGEEGESLPLPTTTCSKRRLGKNPDVDTSFLPDHDREEDEKRLREQLRLEWQQKQEQTKREPVEIVFSYWDGSGHRRSVTMRKGDTIFQFLCKAHEILKREFNELRTAMPDQLVYVKEDLILPHHYSFYDFIITKARGKSGPLFSFDVHEDIRFLSDAKKEKNESHAGKVVLRSWYERNKHIFPASRWEPWDPHRRYDKYTVKDKK